MIEVAVTVEFKGKNYQTNVIVNKDMTEEEIMSLAARQVFNQWKEIA